MTSRQIKAAQLRRRMAIQAMTPHRLPKRPSEVEQHMADTAVDMLVLIQMLPYIMGDLREALEASGQYRHEIKRRHRQVEEIIFTVAEPAYRIFARFNPETARGFLDRVDDLYFRIKSGYGLHGVEGAVSPRRCMSADRTLQPPTRTDLLFRACGTDLQNPEPARLHPLQTTRHHRTNR